MLEPARVKTISIVAKTGNEEAVEVAKELKARYPGVTWLAEEHLAKRLGWDATEDVLLGARADVYTFSVASDLAENSGHRNAGIVSPKASFIFALNATRRLNAW